jgi:hypothetical protein
LLVAQILKEDVFGADVIDEADEVVLFGGGGSGGEVDDFFRTSFFEVVAEGGGVEYIKYLSDPQGEAVLDGADAPGHGGGPFNSALF